MFSKLKKLVSDIPFTRIEKNDAELTELDLSHKNLTDDDAVLLAKSLEKNYSLTSIKLGNNKISAETQQKIDAVLARNRTFLEKLGHYLRDHQEEEKQPASPLKGIVPVLPKPAAPSVHLDEKHYAELVRDQALLEAAELVNQANANNAMSTSSKRPLQALPEMRGRSDTHEHLEREWVPFPTGESTELTNTTATAFSKQPPQVLTEHFEDLGIDVTETEVTPQELEVLDEFDKYIEKREIERLKSELLSIPQEKTQSEKFPTSKEEKPDFVVSYTIDYSKLTFGKELGKGGFGVVYQGSWRLTDVAIKKLLVEHPTDEALEEFTHEMCIMARLRSPFIVQFYGCCLSPPYCIVMEYMPKGSLYSVLHSREPLDWDIRYRILRDIACGLAFLHEENILHRDLKSRNVLLDEHYKARLTDFGLSKIKTETQTTLGTEKSGGTLEWMAPELFQPKGKSSRQSDIYSLGMTFWEVASRKVPFANARAPQLVINWVEKGDREDIPKDCPPKIAKLISFCWNGDPSKRPAAEKIAAFLKSEETEFEKFGGSAPVLPAKPQEPEYVDNLNSVANYQNNFSH